LKRSDVFEFYRRLAETNPHPETELESVNTFTLLVAVVLSAQATSRRSAFSIPRRRTSSRFPKR
jgi:endonuclease III